MRPFVAMTLFAAACASAPAAPSDPIEPLRVRVADVVEGLSAEGPVLHGVTRSTDELTAAFVVSGRVATVGVRVGDRVEAGQVLATLDATPFARRVEALERSIEGAQTTLAQADRDLKRLEALEGTRSVTPQQTEQLRAQVDRGRADIAALRAQLSEASWARSQATLRSPLTGTVVRRSLDPGSVASPGGNAFVLRASDGVELELGLPEAQLDALAEGDRVTVSFPLSGLPDRLGDVVTVADAATPGGLFPVRVALVGDDLRAGLTATVAAPARDDGVLAVPLTAVVSPSGTDTWVHRVRDGQVERVDVQTGAVREDQLEIRGALAPGDEVVVSGHAGIATGTEVEVVR